MPINQISKLQLRRGKKTIHGLPQLSSAEMAWAVDTQELFIGNGSIQEGAPAVGNTKILTEHDNILEVAGKYQYKNGLIASAVKQSLQDRLDDAITNLTFGIGDAVQFQAALDEMFDNVETRDLPKSRITLRFMPGIYNFANSIHIPSYVNLIGAGIDKTIFVFSDNKALIYNTGATRCNLKDFTISCDGQGIELQSVTDSRFENLKLIPVDNTVGMTYPVYIATGCERNVFSSLVMDHCIAGITNIDGIGSSDTLIENCFISNASDGIVLKGNNNKIENCKFSNITSTGISIPQGSGNVTSLNYFKNVHTKITFNDLGNLSQDDYSDDMFVLSSKNTTSAYDPLVNYGYHNHYQQKVIIDGSGTSVPLCRLPLANNIIVSYTLVSGLSYRKGTFTICSGILNDEFDSSDEGFISDISFETTMSSAIILSYTTTSANTMTLSYTYSIL